MEWSPAINSFAQWLTAGARSAQTIKLRTLHLRRLGTDTRVGPWDMTAEILTGWIAHDGWAVETRRSARASVSTFYGWGHATGRIAVNVAAGLPTVRGKRGTPRPAPDHVLEHALARTSDRNRLLILLAALAGLRRGEIARVHTDDILDGALIVHGKGGHDRLVPLHPDLERAINREILRRRNGMAGTGYRYRHNLTHDGYLFPGMTSGHMSADAVGTTLSRLLGPGWSGHTLRHRFASRAYSRGERDIRAVQELLGHSSVVTTQRYTAVPDGALRAAVIAAA